MSNKTAVWIIVGIIVVIGGLVYAMNTPTDNSLNMNNAEENNAAREESQANGRVVFSITDAAADMGAVSEITMQVSRAEVESENAGWVTVSSAPRTYNLLELNREKASKVLADVELPEGTYNQIRLKVDSIVVKTKDGKTQNAKLPSDELRINAKLVVANGETSSVNLDFLADKSLHTTGKGEYIFAPVIKAETRSNTDISVDSATAKVVITGGEVDDSENVGMDIDGSVKANFELKSNQKLELSTDNKIKLGL